MKHAMNFAPAGLMTIGATLSPIGQSALAQTKPNVVFILADNVGYGDLGPYGGGELRGAPTPRIDQLAHEGLRLTQYLVVREKVITTADRRAPLYAGCASVPPV
jgi:hypothetical protein